MSFFLALPFGFWFRANDLYCKYIAALLGITLIGSKYLFVKYLLTKQKPINLYTDLNTI